MFQRTGDASSPAAERSSPSAAPRAASKPGSTVTESMIGLQELAVLGSASSSSSATDSAWSLVWVAAAVWAPSRAASWALWAAVRVCSDVSHAMRADSAAVSAVLARSSAAAITSARELAAGARFRSAATMSLQAALGALAAQVGFVQLLAGTGAGRFRLSELLVEKLEFFFHRFHGLGRTLECFPGAFKFVSLGGGGGIELIALGADAGSARCRRLPGGRSRAPGRRGSARDAFRRLHARARCALVLRPACRG